MLNWLDTKIPKFPPIHYALKEPNGLLCAGGNLEVATLLSAYKQGIFPWFNDDQPIMWWSPDPRMVLFPEQIHIATSMKKWLKKTDFSVTWNTCFDRVTNACATNRSEGTWITHTMKSAYLKMHEAGYAQSVEIWHHKTLVGGLYGPVIGQVFFGESMFSNVSNASKMALIHLAKSPNIKMIDCQFHTKHLESMGARLMPRKTYMMHLKKHIKLLE